EGESTNSSAGFHFWGHAPKNGTLRKLQISSENQFTQNTLHSHSKSFIIHHSSFIIHHSSFIIHRSSLPKDYCFTKAPPYCFWP
ncbi:MAG: hypothetical protein J0L99_21070, partial [Chitinophagales bacterium]|nr:hypothetical protein [Chitinophagales bacterium]